MNLTMTNIRQADIIEFDYTNWKGIKGKRKAVYSHLVFGSNEFHTEPQFLIVGFDLKKMSLRTYAVKDIENIKVLEESKL